MSLAMPLQQRPAPLGMTPSARYLDYSTFPPTYKEGFPVDSSVIVPPCSSVTSNLSIPALPWGSALVPQHAYQPPPWRLSSYPITAPISNVASRALSHGFVTRLYRHRYHRIDPYNIRGRHSISIPLSLTPPVNSYHWIPANLISIGTR